MSNLQAIQNFPVNPISGTYGSGKIQLFSASGTFTRPAGVTNVRARCFGGGGNTGITGTDGSGGGFAIKEIIGVTATVTVTVGGSSGTSSFGTYVSATGGASAGGFGSGGDYNSTGGVGGVAAEGGGVASIFGNGGSGTSSVIPGASGGGVSTGRPGSNGLYGSGASGSVGTTADNPFQPSWSSIDFLGTGGGGSGFPGPGQNGGGGGPGCAGGYPGGGGFLPGRGLVIVEY